ncbi:hypothetical protein HY213_05330 [Candidatus Peregrinibacteria bacterium]|nr:hypothetical protein [Candidatus Peregrinibacteria bacterium]
MTEQEIEEEIERDRQRLKAARERAEELVLDRGWSKKDDDYDIQVEEETQRQWEEDLEREIDRFFSR